MILEFCPRENLQKFIEFYGSIQPPKLYKYCFQILKAVQYLHQNKIAHYNIKPGNILLDSNERIKLTDFGLSQQMTPSSKTKFVGSGMFMAPEVLHKIDGHDPFSADIYSLGVTFYCMYQGKSPLNAFYDLEFRNQNVSDNYLHLDKTEHSFQELIYQMINFDPLKRSIISQLKNNSIFQTVETKSIHDVSSVSGLKQLIPKMKSKRIIYK
jgi:non-specific serine/threonine protein kinase